MIEFLSQCTASHATDGAMIQVKQPCTFIFAIFFMQITTFGPLLTQNYTVEIATGLQVNEKSVKIFQLPDFDTEMDFSNEVR